MKLFQNLKLIIFKPGLKCICCGEELLNPAPHHLCAKCMSALPLINKPCLKCGGQMPAENQYCIRCKSTEFSFKRCLSVFVYSGEVRLIVQRFKYNGARYLAKPLAHLLCETYKKSGIKADLAAFVPLCERRLKARGYNQAQLLAAEFCVITNLPLSSDNLLRIRETPSQTEQTAEARKENILGAFKIENKAEFKNKTVLLIDDVMTTGATLNECSKVLIKAGAKEVYCLTLANTERKIKSEKPSET